MGLFDKPEVSILKETSDAKDYLEKLESLQKDLPKNSELSNKIDKEIAITKAGIIGEDAVMFELKNSGMDLVVLHDLYIETSDGRGAQIDYVVITPYVTVLIECKNLFGNIEINNKGDFIRSFSYGGKSIKEGIYSPITQNERHLTVLKDCKSEDKGRLKRVLINKSIDMFNKSLVVLANPKTVVNDRYAPKDIKQKVIRVDQLITTLKEMKSNYKSTKEEMLSFGESYLKLNRDERKEYLSKFQELVQQSKQTTEIKKDNIVADSVAEKENVSETDNREKQICPWCGKELILRTAKKGTNAGNRFYGCSGYPQCKYIKNIKNY